MNLNLRGENYADGVFVVVVVVVVVTATNTSGHMLDPRYYANRAGKIAALQVPLVVALGMKNNILSCEFLRLLVILVAD